MAYKTEELFALALDSIKNNNLYWIEQIVAYLPCTKPTFYDHFKVDSYEFNELKGLIEKNRVIACQEQNKKWKDSDNATLQISFRKLIGTDIERKRLSQTYHDLSSDGEPIKFEVNWGKSGKSKS